MTIQKKRSVITLLSVIATIMGISFAINVGLTEKKHDSAICSKATMITAQATEGITNKIAEYSIGYSGAMVTAVLDSNYTLRISGTGAMKNFQSGVPWTAYKTRIKTVIIESGVTNIGNSAFSGCSDLSEVTIPETVTLIDTNAFKNCSGLSEIVLPENENLTLGDNAFQGCTKLKSVKLPNGVKTVPNYAFYNCTTLNEVGFGERVEAIGESAFYNCSGLTKIDVPPTVKHIQASAFQNCKKLSEITFSSDGNLQSIDNHAFSGSVLTNIDIPNSVGAIGAYAFSDCTALSQVVIGESVESIGKNAFQGCNKLERITVGKNVKNIGKDCFKDCVKLNSIDYRGDIASWISIDRETTYLYLQTSGDLYVGGTLLTDLTIPYGVTEVNVYAFFNCKSLQNINVSETVSTIDMAAFYACENLETVTFANQDGGDLKEIGKAAFGACEKLRNIELPSGVKTIGDYAFAACRSMEEVFIPDSVRSIGIDAFSMCMKLSSITVDSNNQIYSTEGGVLFNFDKTELLYYPTGKTENNYIIPSRVEKIVSRAFAGNTHLGAIVIPLSVTCIDREAFKACLKLETVYYYGQEADWKEIALFGENPELTKATRYYYSAKKPVTLGNFWHFDKEFTPATWTLGVFDYFAVLFNSIFRLIKVIFARIFG